MNRVTAIFILISIAVTNVALQTLNHQETARAEVYPAIIESLLDEQARDPQVFAQKNRDYLLARKAEAHGRIGLAMINYQAAATRGSELGGFALMHLSQIARATGNMMLERIYLSRMIFNSSGDLLAGAARLRLSKNRFEAGNYADTIRILSQRPQSRNPRDVANIGLTRENQLLVGRSYLALGDTLRARQIFTGLLDSVPKADQPDDTAMAAVQSLDLLDVGNKGVGKEVGQLTEVEHMRRAGIYQFNREFVLAKLHYEAAISANPQGPGSADAAFQIGKGFAQQFDYIHALEWFERMLGQYQTSPAAKDALLQAASGYSRVGKPKEAIKRYQSFIDKYPNDEKLDRAYLNIVDVLRDQADDFEALKWCQKTESAFKGKVPEAVAIFTEARIYMARGEWQNALDVLNRLKAFSDLGGVIIPGGTSTTEVTFLRGFALEQLRQFNDAIDTYLSLSDGRGEYYGWRATLRLRELGKDDTGRSFISQKLGGLSAELNAKDTETRLAGAVNILRLSDSPDLRNRAHDALIEAAKSTPRYQVMPAFTAQSDITQQPSASPHRKIAATLIDLELYDEAAVELEAAFPEIAGGSDNKAFTLAHLYNQGDRADRALTFIESAWKKVPADFPFEAAPRDQLEMLYPAPYAPELVESSRQRGVDPRLLLAIMRQESRFQPDAKSYAAARGLMQFISTTSTHLANELNMTSFSQDELYYPPTSILLGSQYLSDLFNLFPNQPEAVAASYNGGEDNMKRWFTRARSTLPERYVPELQYAQSKDYVYRVMSNYRMYQYLYDENLLSSGEANLYK